MTKFVFRNRFLALAAVVLTGAVVGTVAVAPAAASTAKPKTVQLAAFHSRFGGSRFGGGGFFSRRRSYGYGYGSRGRYYSRPSLFHRIARALAFAYILHLLFTNGAFSVLLWIVVIAIFSHLFRRRPRRYSY
jgi:uncharacterized membrane protein